MWLQLKISIKILIHNTFKYLLQHPLKKNMQMNKNAATKI